MSIQLQAKGHFYDFHQDVTSLRIKDQPWELHGVYWETEGIKRNYALTYTTDEGVKIYFAFAVEWSYRNDADEMRRMMVEGIKGNIHKIPEHQRHPQIVALCK